MDPADLCSPSPDAKSFSNVELGYYANAALSQAKVRNTPATSPPPLDFNWAAWEEDVTPCQLSFADCGDTSEAQKDASSTTQLKEKCVDDLTVQTRPFKLSEIPSPTRSRAKKVVWEDAEFQQTSVEGDAKESQQKVAVQETTEQKAVEKEVLPVGWERERSYGHDQDYYFNRATGESTWENPAQQKAAKEEAQQKVAVQEEAESKAVEKVQKAMQQRYEEKLEAERKAAEVDVPAGLSEKQLLRKMQEKAELDEMDQNCIDAFLESVKKASRERVRTPIKGSNLYTKHMRPCRPAGVSVDVKDSSFINLRSFLEFLEAEGLIRLTPGLTDPMVSDIHFEACRKYSYDPQRRTTSIKEAPHDAGCSCRLCIPLTASL